MNQKNGRTFYFYGMSLRSYYSTAQRCHRFLLDLKPKAVQYFSNAPGKWNEDEIKNENRDLFKGLPKDGGVVYAISLRDDQGKGVWKKQYIGTSKEPRKRIKQHLVACPPGTNSYLKQVQKAVRCGRGIGISWVKIEPSFLRMGVEQMIIGLEKMKDENALPWNELPGKRPGKSSTSRSSEIPGRVDFK